MYVELAHFVSGVHIRSVLHAAVSRRAELSFHIQRKRNLHAFVHMHIVADTNQLRYLHLEMAAEQGAAFRINVHMLFKYPSPDANDPSGLKKGDVWVDFTIE